MQVELATHFLFKFCTHKYPTMHNIFKIFWALACSFHFEKFKLRNSYSTIINSHVGGTYLRVIALEVSLINGLQKKIILVILVIGLATPHSLRIIPLKQRWSSLLLLSIYFTCRLCSNNFPDASHSNLFCRRL